MESFNEIFRNRTKQLAVDVIKFYTSLKKTDEIRIVGNQIVRAATSCAANFRAATRARSDKEYFAKLSITIEETDETLFWFEMLEAEKLTPKSAIEKMMKESEELVAVFAKTRRTIKNNNRINQ